MLKKLMDRRRAQSSSCLFSPKTPSEGQTVDLDGNENSCAPDSPAYNHIGTEVLSLDELSCPPTREELEHFVDVPAQNLPMKYKRVAKERVFVNRDVRLVDVTHYGFDMDYTLISYTSKYESLGYDLVADRLLIIGYPPAIAEKQYDPEFAARCLFFDMELGHLLKVDQFGNILLVFHGRSRIPDEQIMEDYPNCFVMPDLIGKRFGVLNTLFNMPEMCLLADLIDLLCSDPKFKSYNGGFHTTDGIDITYTNIYNDVRSAVNWVHQKGTLKEKTLENLEEYVVRDPAIPKLLERLRSSSSKVFLLTNSGFYYTKRVMTYLLPSREWKSYFDIIIVDACKPKFFDEGTTMREVDEDTEKLKIGTANHFVSGRVYSGGSSHIFQQLEHVMGNEVLYVGDHPFGDVVRSKKSGCWKTLLVIPELDQEIVAWHENAADFNHLRNLEFILAEIYRDLDATSKETPDVSEVLEQISKVQQRIDSRHHKYFGSLFRSGSSRTFFAMQAHRYADLYTSRPWNLLSYPLCYEFRSAMATMPHEDS